jgi:23S rRNA pseudouridine1911/1915/1917 synthase
MRKIRIKNHIIQETGNWIAVYKPAGLAVETGKVGEQDLESLLLNEYHRRGEGISLSIINRLDQVVEGIVLAAKNPKAAAALSKELQKGGFEKIYLAVVRGIPGQEEAMLKDYLEQDVRKNRSYVTAEGKGKKSILSYQVLQTSQGQALLRIRLESGRHHQIRVQLANAGFPIAGDRKYSNEERGTGYPALCAAELSFTDPATMRRISLKRLPQNERFKKFTGLFS